MGRFQVVSKLTTVFWPSPVAHRQRPDQQRIASHALAQAGLEDGALELSPELPAKVRASSTAEGACGTGMRDRPLPAFRVRTAACVVFVAF